MHAFMHWMVTKYPFALAMWLITITANLVSIVMCADLHWLVYASFGCLIAAITLAVRQYKTQKVGA